jgi:hypothetical protein
LKSICVSISETVHRKITNCFSRKQATLFIDMIYVRAIKEPGDLNKYSAFSSNTYGEIGNDLIVKMLTHYPLARDKIFIDLGSGKYLKTIYP